MDDLAYGTRNKRGDWQPKEPADIAPIWSFPPQPLKVLKWLPHYFLPYDVLFFASAMQPIISEYGNGHGWLWK